MSKNYSTDIQEQINNLFDDPPVAVVEETSVVEKEVVEPFDELPFVTDKVRSKINNLFSADSRVVVEAFSDNKEEVEPFKIAEKEVTQKSDIGQQIDDLFETMDVSIEDIVTEIVKPIERKKEVNNENYVSDIAGAMSRVAKRTNKGSGQEKLTEEQLTINNFQLQLDAIKRSIRESTIVSGIGQGGDGQTPGSGVVRIRDLDDVDLDNITNGDSLVWDDLLGSFVPGAGGTGGGGIGRLTAGNGIVLDPPGGTGSTIEISTDLELGDLNDVIGTPTDGDLLIYNGGNWSVGTLNTSELNLAAPQGNPFNVAMYSRYEIVADGVYTTQQDANVLFMDLINDLDERIEELQPDLTDPDASLIGQLDDVSVAGVKTGDFLVYDGDTSIWNATTVPIPNVVIDSDEPNTGNEQQGDLWYRTDTGELYIYNNVWTVVSTSGGASVDISPSPPVGAPEVGNLWVETDSWSLYVYDGFNWVGLTHNGISGSDGSVPIEALKAELLAAVNSSTDYDSLKSALITVLS